MRITRRTEVIHMEKNKGGRPPKVDLEKLISDADEYIKTANPPILAEYAHMHGITRQYLYQLADIKNQAGDHRLSDTIKKISEAKEIILERKTLTGEYNSTMAVFSLKQLGWKDRTEIDANTEALEKMDEIFRKMGGVE